MFEPFMNEDWAYLQKCKYWVIKDEQHFENMAFLKPRHTSSSEEGIKYF